MLNPPNILNPPTSAPQDLKQPKAKTKKRRLSKKNALIARLPELLEGKTVKGLARELGYTEGSRNMYRNHIKSQVKQVFTVNKESLQRELDYLLEQAKKKGDLSNANRSLETLLRTIGGLTDKQEVTTQQKITPDIDKSILRKELRDSIDNIDNTPVRE